MAGSVASTFSGLGRRDFWLAGRFPQVCVQTVRLVDEHPVSLNAAYARNLRFLDREREIIYPWTREGLVCRQVRAWELAGTDDMGRILSCPRGKKDGLLRSHPQSPREHLASFLFVAPFRCPSCSHRFLASHLWLDHSTHPIDRREHLRIPVRLYLSMGGCIIKSETQVHMHDIFYLQLSISEGELPLEVAAMVRSVSARGIAFKFLRAAQENKRLLAFVQAQTPDQPDKSSLNAGVAA